MDRFSLRYGQIPVVVASSTEAAREILKVHDAAFASRPPVTIGRLFVNFSDIVFAPYGESWRHLRKIATLKLFTARRIKMFRRSRMEDVKWLCHSLVASSQRDEVVDVRGHMRALSFNFITFMLMGKRYFTDSGVKDEQGKRFVDVIEESILVGFFTTRDFFPWLPNFILDFAEKHIKSLAKSLDEFLGGDILEHENKMKNTASQNDFLAILLNLHDERVQKHNIKGVMTNLIIAGTDTSAVTLEWALAETVKHPAVAARAREEIDRVLGSEARTRMVEEPDIPQLTYLQAIVKETLRLHPAVPLLLPHQSTEPVSDVMGYHIPCGTTVIINAYAISRDTSTWGDDALLFQPERFLETSVDIRGGNFEAIPFGSGRRQCPGMALGLQVIHITLANLLHGFEWREPKGKSIDTVNEKIGLTLVMANKLELIPTPRLGLNVLCPPRNLTQIAQELTHHLAVQ